MAVFIDLSGQVFGDLTVVGLSGQRATNGRVLWDCSCSCGNSVLVKTSALRLSGKVDCGCGLKNRQRNANMKHGYKGTKVYSVVDGVIRRCHDKKKDNYKTYGEKGIFVCDTWKNNRETFCKWLEDNGYRDGLQIDRKDNSKGYSPENCRLIPNTYNNINKVGANQLGVCGIVYREDCTKNPFLAYVRVYGKYYELGYSSTLLDACCIRKGFTNKLCERVATLCRDKKEVPIKDLRTDFDCIIQEEIKNYNPYKF